MEEQWILQETEFQILAAAMGIESFYGIRPQEEAGEAEVMYAIHEMTAKGMLMAESGGFRIADPYRRMFASMKTAKRILAVAGNNAEKEKVCFYFGKQIVSLEKSVWDAHAVRIGSVKKGMLYAQLCDRGFLPEPFWEPDIAQMQEAEDVSEQEAQIYASYQILEPAQEKRESGSIFRLLRVSCNYWVSEGESGLVRYEKKQFYERLINALE
ncbi:MAG: hypothetical protein NC254_12285 [bacterium]|nr:hypothetical protein [bacterium]